MEINDLRKIGKKLIKEVSTSRHFPDSKSAIGYGAAGDRTFPIDSKAEEIILSGLKSLREPLTVVSEEAGVVDLNGGGKRVIIDPIDGSKNAISGIPFYCTSIAIADGDVLKDVHISYIINLINGDEFWAERYSGAFLNDTQIHTQKDNSFYLTAYEAQVPGSDIPKIFRLLSQSRKTRCLGAIALDLAYLAYGAVSVFVSPSPSRSFDFAGGWLLIKESGGIITNFDGEEIHNTYLDLKRSTALVASGNQKLHKRAIQLVTQNRYNV